MTENIKAFPVDIGIVPPLYSGMDLRDYFMAHARECDVEPFKSKAKMKLEADGNNMYTNADIWILAKTLYADAIMKEREKVNKT